MDIHPDIRAFWERRGKIGYDVLDSEPVHLLYWFIYPGIGLDIAGTYIAYQPHGQETIRYSLNGESYTEEEMLRLIKLKAFL
jgi:hypothetical protein